MLEIIAIISLCKKAKNNALERGKEPTVAVIYTILLWFGMEIWGAIITIAILIVFGVYPQLHGLFYLTGLGCAALGGYIAILISKMAAPISTANLADAPNGNTVDTINKNIS